MSQSPSTTLSGHIPSLDGLRAFSVLLVLIAHVATTHQAPAWMAQPALISLGNSGVRFFFVISGFLITSLLLREQARHGTISLKQFYLRRAYRILPAALTYIGLIWLAYQLGWIELRFHIHSRALAESAVPDLIHALTFTSNYQHDYNWYYNHLWSLSVEEQFYLFWPFALVMAKTAGAKRVALAAIVLCPLIRLGMYLWTDKPDIALSREFQAVADALATGCLMGLLLPRLQEWPRLQAWLLHPLWPVLMGGALLATGYGSAFVSRPFAYIGGQCLANAGIAMLISHAVLAPQAWAGRVLNLRPLATLGVMSYSIYLWQEPFMAFYLSNWPVSFPQNLMLTLVAATLSYHLVEKPFLRIKDRLHPPQSARSPS